MTTPQEMKRKVKEHEEALRKNPLLAKGLGNLIEEQIILILKNSGVTQINVPTDEEYLLIKKELGRREGKYTRRPLSETRY